MLTVAPGSIASRVLDCFPSGTYALHALFRVLEIVETESIPTAAVECKTQPRLLVNPRFVEEHAETPEKLLMLVMHELHHVLLGHTTLFPRQTQFDNLVFDAVINSLLCRMFPGEDYTRFFSDLYRDDRFPECFLRPTTGWRRCITPVALAGPEQGRARDVYLQLYSDAGASYEDLREVLRQPPRDGEQADGAASFPVLLGDHGDGPSSSGGVLEERSPVLFDAVRRIVEDWPQPPNPIAGRSFSDALNARGVAVMRLLSNRESLRGLLRRVGGQTGNSRLHRGIGERTVEIETPIPSLHRRTAVLTALSARPLLFPSSIAIRRPVPSGERVHVYLDVSGSIGDLIGPLYAAVLDCQAFVHPKVHLFSTVVSDVSLDELRHGVCKTTGGTDIGCVAADMEQRHVRRAVLITDGYTGRPGGSHRTTLERARLGVALTPGVATRNDLEAVANHWAQLAARQS